MRTVDKIIIHCTATPEGRPVTIADVDKWHKERGFVGIGYHYLIGLNGEIWKGRDEWKIGAHTLGENQRSIGIAYVGGMTKDMKKAKDTRTELQKKSMLGWLAFRIYTTIIRWKRNQSFGLWQAGLLLPFILRL